ncbi:MAG: hypothetical protein QW548_00795 [Candidatus Aenigmatarchaeota archaeon]
MRGFVITPVLFIAAMAITALLLHSHFALSSQAVSAIDLQSALAKLRADELKNRLDIENSLYWFALASGSGNCTAVEGYLETAMRSQGRNGTVRVQPGTSEHFLAFYSEMHSAHLGPAALSKNVTVAAWVPGNCT